MGLVKCYECGCDLSPTNFHEVERVKTGETVTLCNTHYDILQKEGRLEVIDDDGNRTCGDLHIYRGTNTDSGLWPRPCPNCGSFTYLGKLIPTVSWFYAEYLGTSYQCHNKLCDPVYEEGHEGEFDCIEQSGAYWDDEDELYYTPQSPRL